MVLKVKTSNAYTEQGFALADGSFAPDELLVLDREIGQLVDRKIDGLVYEADGRTLRAMHGMHLFSPIFDRLARDARMLGPACEILGGDVYLHQYKLNFKHALGGDLWPWHQDYIFWEREDGFHEPRLVSVAIFLDEVHEFNGPLCFIPGSHREGVIAPAIAELAEEGDGDAWEANFSRDLQYTVNPIRLRELMNERGIAAPKGEAGTILVFHPNVVHGSAPNISVTDRRLLIATYNRTDNLPREAKSQRPEYLVGRDYRPLAAAAPNGA